ncbi:hypothetical protein I4F81_003531 [Pyropia yezoensis]|uniref:Uncharacterized protein n=1 Tax=Pyropia yezoensis TaxID=2788 RepID=A0ACC3BT74_PYRYE|nr:hypothetical protein I4F81_003531 [Neopyropia yezoensis]
MDGTSRLETTHCGEVRGGCTPLRQNSFFSLLFPPPFTPVIRRGCLWPPHDWQAKTAAGPTTSCGRHICHTTGAAGDAQREAHVVYMFFLTISRHPLPPTAALHRRRRGSLCVCTTASPSPRRPHALRHPPPPPPPCPLPFLSARLPAAKRGGLPAQYASSLTPALRALVPFNEQTPGWVCPGASKERTTPARRETPRGDSPYTAAVSIEWHVGLSGSNRCGRDRWSLSPPPQRSAKERAYRSLRGMGPNSCAADDGGGDGASATPNRSTSDAPGAAAAAAAATHGGSAPAPRWYASAASTPQRGAPATDGGGVHDAAGGEARVGRGGKAAGRPAAEGPGRGREGRPAAAAAAAPATAGGGRRGGWRRWRGELLRCRQRRHPVIRRGPHVEGRHQAHGGGREVDPAGRVGGGSSK